MKLIYERLDEIITIQREQCHLIVKMLATESTAPVEVLLHIQDVAKIFNKSERTIYEWRITGVLKFVKVGRSTYYKQSDVNILLNKRAA